MIILLVKITDDLEGEELYERSRGCWRASLKSINSSNIQYVFVIYNQKIKEVFHVNNWDVCDRDGFTGSIFNGEVEYDDFRNKYKGISVSHLYEKGNANPIMYKELKEVIGTPDVINEKTIENKSKINDQKYSLNLGKNISEKRVIFQF